MKKDDKKEKRWYDWMLDPIREEIKLREFFLPARKAQMN